MFSREILGNRPPPLSAPPILNRTLHASFQFTQKHWEANSNDTSIRLKNRLSSNVFACTNFCHECRILRGMYFCDLHSRGKREISVEVACPWFYWNAFSHAARGPNHVNATTMYILCYKTRLVYMFLSFLVLQSLWRQLRQATWEAPIHTHPVAHADSGDNKGYFGNKGMPPKYSW